MGLWIRAGLVLVLSGCTLLGGGDRSKRVVRVAVCQILCIDGDRSGNLRRIQNAVEEAARAGAALACFPEAAVLGWVNPEAHEQADPIPGATTAYLGEMARRNRVMVAIGIAEKDGERLHDSVVLFDRDGTLLAVHRKINILSELMTPPYAPGRIEEIKIVDTMLGRIGMLVCADTFLEDVLDEMTRYHPDLVIVPYGWAAAREDWPAHAASLEKVVAGAARRLGCPVVGTDLVGVISHGPWTGMTYGGASAVANEEGEILARGRDRDVEVRVVEVPVKR